MGTRWQPDTCECVFDDYDDDAKRTVAEACSRHANADPAVVYSSAVADNNKKNKILAAISPGKQEAVRWSFDSDGTLNLITAKPIQSAMLADLRAQFGKIRVSQG